ncbi:MAG: Rpn family recombination-promoting nuclease/putative transposase [Dysgonamonadaceae bacterium]|jgi:predicted transposase/invertase (TIGR01784 family)|nr:Rpn family recombination-promoting nuclease/putative transposase [Dysgonamonadaceae bacterium]
MIPEYSNERPLVSFDWAIKRLLRNKTNYEVVEGFLSELLKQSLKITNILESESNREDPDDKSNRVDITVEDTAGEIILIELQFLPQADYFHRMLYGASKTIADHIFRGERYIKVRKVYSINIVYFDLGQGTDYVYHGKTSFKGLHHRDILKLSAKQRKTLGEIEAGNIFPEYYVLKINNFDDVAKNTLDEWIYFLKHDRIKDEFKAKGLLKAREVMDYYSLPPKEKANYDYEQDMKSRRLSEIATAKEEGILETEEKYAKVITEKDRTIEEKDKAIEEKDRELAELRRLLNR